MVFSTMVVKTFTPAVGTTWQIMLIQPPKVDKNTASMTPDVAVYDVDLFDATKNGADTTIIDNLHRLGKKVICYFSAGSYEPRRPDSSQFSQADLGANVTGWPGEKWLNLKSQKVADIMTARIQLAGRMGCDAVDPDNMDAYVSLQHPRISTRSGQSI